jgi:hypothetical protein
VFLDGDDGWIHPQFCGARSHRCGILSTESTAVVLLNAQLRSCSPPRMARAAADNAGTRHLFGLDHCDIDVLKRREDARWNEGDRPTDMLGAGRDPFDAIP